MNHHLGLSSSINAPDSMQEKNTVSSQQSFDPERPTGGEQPPISLYLGVQFPYSQYTDPSPSAANLVTHSSSTPIYRQQEREFLHQPRHPQQQPYYPQQQPPPPPDHPVSFNSQGFERREVDPNFHLHFPDLQLSSTMGGGEFVPGFNVPGEVESTSVIGTGQALSFTGHSYSAPETGVQASSTAPYNPHPPEPTCGDTNSGTVPLLNYDTSQYMNGGFIDLVSSDDPESDLQDYEYITADVAPEDMESSDQEEEGECGGYEECSEVDADEAEDDVPGKKPRQNNPRKAFDVERRKSTAETRKRRACLRCRQQRTRVS